ncbi:phosphatidate cytidylyltransferase [Fusobacterium sp.]|uniref:phosphatidate cytidylyltransferase n=1 Tax=Fusobacterium sp. TaxID=68766 RepID=UPI0026148451|nr:phosphatidate cytidylyltransferase [Fusobacterium sp.]
MLNRILVALIGIPILMYVYYSGGIPLLVFTNIIVGIGLYEFYKMSELSGQKPFSKLGILAGLTIPNLIYFLDPLKMGVYLFLPLSALIICAMGVRIFENKVENASVDIGVTALGVAYISILFSHILLLTYLPNGGAWLIAIQVMVWVCDSAAYFVGINIGRKFFKEGFSIISPKKSKEGAIGAIIFTILAICLINYKYQLIPENYPIVIALGFLVSIVAQIGDLAESMFKREFKIKDSGRILGEHGGILDRFDSMIFVVPTVYYILKIFVY